MTHTVCQSGTQDDTFTHFDWLTSTFLDPDTDLRTKLEAAFRLETTEFRLPYAFLTHIDRTDDVQYVQVAHGTHDRLQAGSTAPLSESYCRKTVSDPDGTVRVSDALEEGWADDPAYDLFELGSYVGATVEVEGEVYGTLCFASSDPRDDPITEREAALVRLLAQWVGHELDGWGAPSAQAAIGADLEDALLSRDMDRMMEICCAPQRRLILLYLLDGTIENEQDLAAARDDSDRAMLELRHHHLPKLATEGYVEWDPDTGAISEGPRLAEVEPFFDLLTAYLGSAPDVF